MAEVIQRVRTIFDAESKALRGDLARLTGQLDGLKRAAMGVLGAYGLGSLIKGMVDLNAKAETGAIGIATLIQAADRMRGTVTPFNSALGIAKTTLEDLRQVAVDTPATFDQVAESFKAIVFPARGAGLNMKAIAQLAGDVATLEAAEGSPGMISRDIAQLMRGTNNVDSQFLRPYKDELLKLVRQGKQATALGRVREIIQLDPDARRASGESFEGRMSTFKDQIDAFKKAAGEPIFAAANEGLAEASRWLAKNKEEVKAVAKAVGEGLVKAFVAVKDAVVWLVDSGVAKIAVYIYAGVKAAGILAGAFRLLIPILGGLAASPLWVAIAGAAALVAGMVAGIEAYRNFDPNNAKNVAENNRENLGKAGGMGASAMQAWALVFNGNVKGGLALLNASADEFDKPAAVVDARAAQRDALAAAQKRSLEAAEASDARRRRSETTARTSGKPSKMQTNIDARGAKVTVNTELRTDDPSRFASTALKTAFVGVSARPLGAVFGLGTPALANGRR